MNDRIRVDRYTGGGNRSGNGSLDVSFNSDEWHVIRSRWEADQVELSVLDQDDTVIAGPQSFSADGFGTEGYLGVVSDIFYDVIGEIRWL